MSSVEDKVLSGLIGDVSPWVVPAILSLLSKFPLEPAPWHRSHKIAPSFAFPSFLLFLAHSDQLRPLVGMDKFIKVFASFINVYVVYPYVGSRLARALFRLFWLSHDGDVGALPLRERIVFRALDMTMNLVGGFIVWLMLWVLWFMYTIAKPRFGWP